VLADAGSTPAASTISYNVVDQHRPHNPKKTLGFCGLPQLRPLVLNSPISPMFGHTVGTSDGNSIVQIDEDDYLILNEEGIPIGAFGGFGGPSTYPYDEEEPKG